MKFNTILKTTCYAVFFLLLISTTTQAGIITYKCQSGPMCIDERVNFGMVQIRCTDVNGDVLADWICEYEAEYTCKNTLTGQTRAAGFNPLSGSLCEKLCGPCKEGWK
ncbi:hypothetical protein [Maridesulfovibrio hydrothermalis]|uniref:Secreted protein n=1 Tax=Maridesulfovibrio hydrothermalis AM13 = DSM 14728 TaxID=1121451 RepID=L0REN6_9BACT|nr:hypothetical protein [Maridesulfovibrio hydrothermalis]CCO24655.1 conserved exported protein of unknown function [Maridesulfovibrio hydrothermalis AM13 = DSM 14728]